MNKRILILTIALIAFIGQSCEDYLKEEIVSDISAGSYYTTPQGFEDAVKATYSFMKPYFGVERGMSMTVFGTDVHTNGADGGHKAINRYDGGLNADENYMRDTWRDFYQGINQANAVINRSENIGGLEEEIKAERIGEVRFLRALYYFFLTQTYGDIHLTLEETEGVETTANKTPASEIYSQAIIPDLKAAIAVLPGEQGDYGRATKPAAEFLLSKVLMTRYYKSFGEANDAVKAEQLMTSVIENYNFSLMPSFDQLWDQGNQINSEVIFAVINSFSQTTEGIDGNGNRAHLYFLMEYDVLPGMLRDTENGRPWKRFRPTPFLLSLWDREKDSRYDYSYKHVWYANNESNIPVWTQEEANKGYVDASKVGQRKFAVGDTAVFIPGPGKNAEWNADRQAATRYMVATKDEYTEKLFPSLNKFIDPLRPNRQHTQGSRDWILMRLADAYLIRAEARLAQNDTEGAAEDINVVRRRAAWAGKEDEIEIASAEVTLDFILDERARELDGEMHRWFDLVRTGKLVERVRLYNPEARDNIRDYHVVRPIPIEQIDRTEGGYPQNSGYPGAD